MAAKPTKNTVNIANEVGSDYYSNNNSNNLSLSFATLNQDSFEQIVNRYGKWHLYEEMRNIDPLIGSFLNLIESFATSEELLINPVDGSDEAKEYAELIKGMLFEDMEVSLSENIKDWLTMVVYGFSLSEVVLKKRLGNNPSNPKKHSKFNDGLIGIRKFAPRPQKTINNWYYDDYGRLSSVGQSKISLTEEVRIPYSKLLHFKIKSYNSNPEGTSLLKSAALPYFEKRSISREQKIQASRGFKGIPTLYIPASWADKNNPNYAEFQSWAMDTVKGLKTGVDSGLVLPFIPAPDGKTPALRLDIVGGSESSNEDTDKMLARCEHDMSVALLSDFFLLSKTSSMSGSIGSIKVNTFKGIVISLLDIITSELNNKLIPLIFDINNLPRDKAPKIDHSNLSTLDTTNLMLFIQSMSKHSLFTPSYERELAISKIVFGGKMPEISREEWEQQQELNRLRLIGNIAIDGADTDSIVESVDGKPNKD